MNTSSSKSSTGGLGINIILYNPLKTLQQQQNRKRENSKISIFVVAGGIIFLTEKGKTNKNKMGGFTESQDASLIYARFIVSAVSLSGSLFIIAAFSLFRDLRGFTFQLIFFLSVSDALYSIGYLIPPTGVF
jgi:hypothetical protein